MKAIAAAGGAGFLPGMRVKLTLLAALSLGWTTAVNGVETGSKKSTESDIMQVLATTPTLDLLRVAQAYAEGLDAAEARARVALRGPAFDAG